MSEERFLYNSIYSSIYERALEIPLLSPLGQTMPRFLILLFLPFIERLADLELTRIMQPIWGGRLLGPTVLVCG